jgi:hypothetical protein
MRICSSIIVLFLFQVLFEMAAYAQPFLQRNQELRVSGFDGEMAMPWAGGLNSPQFSSMDLNRDGKNDLFVFDRETALVLTFLAVSKNDTTVFEFAPEYAASFPKIKDWALLRDFNCDGRMDIFTSSVFGPGTMVYEQTEDFNFTIADSLLLYAYDFGTNSGVTNLFISKVDNPAIMDMDGDGDLDILTFQVNSSQIEYSKNFSMDRTGTCGLDFELKNRCWGYFDENILDGTFELGKPCFNVVDPERKANLHTGSSVLVMELNGDTLPDLLIGDIAYERLSALYNGGLSREGLDSITSFDYHYPVDDPVELYLLPAAYAIDLLGDTLLDLVVAPLSVFEADNRNTVLLYENKGTAFVPDFKRITGAFLQGDMIDVGYSAYPVLEDVNADGLPDLLIGNRNAIEEGMRSNSIWYFRNEGTINRPEFVEVTSNWQGFNEKLPNHPKPIAFIDLDGNASKDILLGKLDGTISYVLNSAEANDPYEFNEEVETLRDHQGEVIDVGNYACPVVFDLDGDSDKDLILGNDAGRLVFYENIAGTSTPRFQFRTDTLGGVQATGVLPITGYATPHFYRENDVLKLIVGSETGELKYYTDIEGNLSGTFTLYEGPGSDIYEGNFSAPWVADLNRDGFLDLMIGNARGGISLFNGSVVSPFPPEEPSAVVRIYPNPTNTYLVIDPVEDQPFRIRIFTASGALFYEENQVLDEAVLTTDHWSAGVYIIQVEYASKVTVHKVIKY